MTDDVADKGLEGLVVDNIPSQTTEQEITLNREFMKLTGRSRLIKAEKSVLVADYLKIGVANNSFVEGIFEGNNTISGKNTIFHMLYGDNLDIRDIEGSVVVLNGLLGNIRLLDDSHFYLVITYNQAKLEFGNKSVVVSRGIHEITPEVVRTYKLAPANVQSGVIYHDTFGPFVYFGTTDELSLITPGYAIACSIALKDEKFCSKLPPKMDYSADVPMLITPNVRIYDGVSKNILKVLADKPNQ